MREKWRVNIKYGKISTQMRSDVTSENPPLEIEGVKYKYGPAKLASRLIKIEGEKGGKEEETAP